jgi:hypothetical protein
MSQEEIEALMNGLDIVDDSDSEEETVAVNTQEIEELLSKTEEIKDDIKIEDEEIVKFDAIQEPVEFKTSVNNSDIEKLLNEIENASNDKKNLDEQEESILDSIECEAIQEKPIIVEKRLDRTEDEIVKDWTSSKINEGVFPLPAENDTKVVSQLSQVANDSEEKVSQIFDVLSLMLDNNNELRNSLKEVDAFVNAQASLLNSLNSKFPNIKIFDEHLLNANKISNLLKGSKDLINLEDSKIFEAMELMQFNDINRQKIERVMSVIRKLSLYLNNLFEDDGTSKDIAVAKHIPGDTTNDLIGDDLDKLIAEFSHN